MDDKKYSASKGLKIFNVFSVLMIGLLFYFCKDELWTCLLLAMLFIFSLVTIASTFIDCLIIRKSDLLIIRNLRKKVVVKGSINKVCWAKGCPTILILNNDETIELPELDVLPLQLKNTLMKWNAD